MESVGKLKTVRLFLAKDSANFRVMWDLKIMLKLIGSKNT